MASKKQIQKKETKKRVKEKKHLLPPLIQAERFRHLPLYVGAGCALICWLLLVVFERDLLFRVQELSLFLYTKLYFDQLMVVPGGMLSYLGSFLNQFFYYPALGALIMVLLWWFLYYAVYRTFKIPAKWALLALIPVLALLASNMELGYWLFHIKVKGYFFYNTLGFLFAVLAVWGFRKLPYIFKLIFVPVWMFAGYPLLGVYALYGGVGMIFTLFRVDEEMRASRKWSVVALILLTSAVAPLAWYYYYNQISLLYLYVAGRPNFELQSNALYLWLPYVVLLAVMVVYPLLYRKDRAGEADRPRRYLLSQLAILVIALFITQFYWYRNTNFRAEMKMNAAMENLQWEKVLDVAKNTPGTPTRLMVMNKNLALIKLGRLGNEMFHYPDGGEAPDCPFEVHMMQVGGKMLYYHYAKFNFCHRWCLEDGVEYGWKVDYLKYLAKCALLSGEYDLSKKYLQTLEQTLFYKDWAQKYEKFLGHPELIAKEPEFAPILQLYCYDNQLDGDNTLVEIYLLNFFAHNSNVRNTKMYDDVAMMAALTLKDIETFWKCFFRYAESHKDEHMPIHYQEAALLYGTLEHKVDISKMPFDKAVTDKFKAFMDYTSQNRGKSEEELRPYYYPQFGDTFYYFYFFIRNVKSN